MDQSNFPFHSEKAIERFLDSLEKRFDKIDKKLEELVKFKWQTWGGIVVIVFITGLVASIIR